MTLVEAPLTTLDYVTGAGIATSAVAGTETTVLSTDVVNGLGPEELPPGGVAFTVIRPITIDVDINVTPGTSTTSITIRCRQGIGIGGAQVGPAYVHTVGAQATQLHLKFRDSSGVPFGVAGTAYTVTIAQAAVTVAGTVNNVDIEVRN